MNLKLSNYEVGALAEFIHNLTLKAKQSRWRTKFYNELAKHHNEMKNFEYELLKEYANLDEDGNIKFVDKEKGLVDIPTENTQKYQKHLAELLNEEFILECNEANKKMIIVVAEILLEGDFDVTPEMAGFYALWCDKFEEVLDFYEEK